MCRRAVRSFAAVAGVAWAVLCHTAATASERWTVVPAESEGNWAIVAEHDGSAGRQSYTLETAPVGAILATPAIAIDDGGRAAAAWVSERASGSTLFVARFDGTGWGSPGEIASSDRYLGQPSLAADGRGGWWVAFVRDSGQGDDIALCRWLGSGCQEVRTFGEAAAPDIEPRLSRTPGGETVLSWLAFSSGRYLRVETPVGTPGGDAPVRVATAAAQYAEPSDPRGASAGIRGGQAWSDGADLLSAPLTDEAPVPETGSAATGTAAAAAAASVIADQSVVLGLGDSTTWGRGSLYQGPPTDYLTRLGNRLYGPWVVLNAGHPGYTSARLLGTADGHLAARPGVTLLMIGINDAFERVSASTVAVNVRALVDKIRAAGSFVVLATTTPIIDSGSRAAQYLYLKQVVNPAIRGVAAAAKVPLVDIWDYFHGLEDWRSYIYAPHGNHLTDAGYELVASRFLTVLRRNDLALPAVGTARGPLLADVRFGVWELPTRGERTEEANAGAGELVRDIASPLANNGVIAATPIDLDGDGIDSVALLRARAGKLSLTVHSAPPAGTLTQAAALAGVVLEVEAGWLGSVCACTPGQQRVQRSLTHLFAIDQDGDGKDEIGLVCSLACAPSGALPVERQVVEIWRAHQPQGGPPKRLVRDSWLLPANGRIRDIAAIQVDADRAEEIVILAQNPDVGSLHLLATSHPDALRLLSSGRYGRLFDCTKSAVPAGWTICDRWESSGRTSCGLVELRTLTPQALIYDTPPAGAFSRAANNERLLYSWWFRESAAVTATCADNGRMWFEHESDILAIAAADIDLPANGRDELLTLRLSAAGGDGLEAWSLPAFPAPAGRRPALAAADRWVRVDPTAQYLLRAGTIPDGAGGARPGVFLWLNRRN